MAEGALPSAVGVPFATDADAPVPADAIRAVEVVGAGPAGAVIPAARCLVRAIRVDHALDAHVLHHVADLGGGAVGVDDTAAALASRRITDPARAIAIVVAVDAHARLTVTGLPAAILRSQTTHADLPRAAHPVGAVLVVETRDAATIRLLATALWAIGVGGALDADAVAEATPVGPAVGVAEAVDAPADGGAATVGAMVVGGALDAAPGRVTPTLHAVGVDQAEHAPALRVAAPLTAVLVAQTRDATPVRGAEEPLAGDPVSALSAAPVLQAASQLALGVLGALDARSIDASKRVGAAGVVLTTGADVVFTAGSAGAILADATAHAPASEADPLGTPGVVAALHASLPLADPGPAIGVRPAGDASPRLAHPSEAVFVSPTAHAGLPLADAVAAVLIGDAVRADPRRVADPAAQAVAVRGALHADVAHRIADGTLRALGAPATLDARAQPRVADARLAVLVGDAGNTRVPGSVADPLGAVRVVAAGEATPPGVAGPHLAVLVAQALHAPPARRLTVRAPLTVGVVGALAAEARRQAPRRRRARVVLGVAGHHTRAAGRVADLPLVAAQIVAGGPRSAAVAGDAELVCALEALGAHLAGPTRGRAAPLLPDHRAAVVGAAAVVVGAALATRPRPVGAARAGLGAVLAGLALQLGPAVGGRDAAATT